MLSAAGKIRKRIEPAQSKHSYPVHTVAAITESSHIRPILRTYYNGKRTMSGDSKLPTPRAWREQRQKEAQAILERLPEISDPEFTLAWDMETSNSGSEEVRHWVIRHGSIVIYQEPARQEDYHRFELLARLLRQKYGNRVRDLVPAGSSDVSYYLYGDFLGGLSRVEAARKRNFGQ